MSRGDILFREINRSGEEVSKICKDLVDIAYKTIRRMPNAIFFFFEFNTVNIVIRFIENYCPFYSPIR